MLNYSLQTTIIRLFTSTVLLALLGLHPAMANCTKPVTLAWDNWPPYQYQRDHHVTGLDIELITAIVQAMGCKIEYQHAHWFKQLARLRDGTLDLATGASITDRRKQYAYFSDPYREESIVLYALVEPFKTVKITHLKDIIGTSLRIGATHGYYYGEEYAKLIHNPAFVKHIVLAKTDDEGIVKLQEGEIDGLLGDPVVLSELLRQSKKKTPLYIHPIPLYKSAVHIMISKKNHDQAFVDQFNQSLKRLQDDGTYQVILRRYTTHE